MYKKKLIALSLAALIPVSLPLLAEQETERETPAPAAASQPAEPVSTDAAGADSEAAAQPEAAQADTENAVTESKSSAPHPYYGPSLEGMEERWQRRNQHYEDLKKRAETLGVILPEKPPWEASGAMDSLRPSMEERMQRHEQMMSMSPDEIAAMRKQHYEEMRDRAKADGVDLPELPPWERHQQMMDDEWTKQQAVIDGMTDEERAACHAMLRRQMGMWDYPERPKMPAPGMGPGMGRGMGPGMMGPGYGYGPDPYGYGPDPYSGRQNFWNPNQ